MAERYDRVRSDWRWARILQEDMCQAIGLHPTRKHEAQVRERWREQSSNPEEDIQSFVDATMFNWLIAGTDAHVKNYALQLRSSGAVRLPPLYDLVSILPYRTVDAQKAKLAMKIGGEYRLRNIGLRNWRKFAVDLRLQEVWLIKRMRAMAGLLPDCAATLQNELKTAELLHGTIRRLARRLKARASSCGKLLLSSDSVADQIVLPADSDDRHARSAADWRQELGRAHQRRERLQLIGEEVFESSSALPSRPQRPKDARFQLAMGSR